MKLAYILCIAAFAVSAIGFNLSLFNLRLSKLKADYKALLIEHNKLLIKHIALQKEYEQHLINATALNKSVAETFRKRLNENPSNH